MGLYDRTAVAYDIMERSLGKDYEAEAEILQQWLRAAVPDASSLLDVGCGLGEHLACLSSSLPRVEGVELSAGMIAEAGRRHPSLTIHAGDLRSFRLPATFDAVTCLHGTIGYMPTQDELARGIANLAAHVRPGGVLIIEGWYTPEQWPAGRMATHVTSEAGIGVGRLVASTKAADGSRSQMHMTYLVYDGGEVEHAYEVHTQGLFTDSEYDAAMVAAGLQPVPSPGRLGGNMPVRMATRPPA